MNHVVQERHVHDDEHQQYCSAQEPDDIWEHFDERAFVHFCRT